ncbi:type IX secretion system sortase PorU [Labilibacter marinus]|uniref:type IX secretion system sortase PorU n=1 Tax=Labilibacter marinus TaxID=1477105 RepID=UPI00094FAC3F|nr:type IX secretion system sortase PorU [Labilibacter marinus]
MCIKKIGLWGFFCIISITIHGQVNTSYTKKVKWEEAISLQDGDRDVTLLQFSNMGDLNSETNIPYISESIPILTENPQSVHISISDEKYIWPTPLEHTSFASQINNKELKYTYSISQSGQQYYLDIDIYPVIKPESAQSFQKLSSYTINLSYQENKAPSLKSYSANSNYTNKSVLSEGSWVKVSVQKSGIHKISYSTLKEWGISNPQNVGIYGNGGKMLPALNSDFRHDDLVENSVWHNNNTIFFYAEGPVTWTYNEESEMFIHEKNNFSNYSYYFITQKEDNSKDILSSTLQTDLYEEEIDYFTDFAYYEEDNFNIIKSGNVWFGEKFDYYTNTSSSYNYKFPNTVFGSKSKVYAKVAARSNTTTEFEIYANEMSVDKTDVYNINTSSHTSYFAREANLGGSFDNITDDISLRLDFNLKNSQSSSIGYLDYICLNVDRELTFVKNELVFRNHNFVKSNNTVKYKVKGADNLIIWDVTNSLSPLNLDVENEAGVVFFNYKADELKEFVAFDPNASFASPEFVKNLENQNLHGSDFANYIIVTHPEFKGEAERLGTIHQGYNGMSYKVVTTEQIYNEFSSGKPDVTAIRDFVRMLYKKAEGIDSKKPHNLLLFGDGSYDNRQGIAENTNKVLTYQSDNSIHQTNSFVSDDYFGLLDDTEGANIKSEKVDIGIGRFPVNTLEEAKNAVDRTYNYYYNQSDDSWKSELTFIGDDGDNNIHMNDANSLTLKLESTHPEYNISKVYFDAFEKVTTTSGHIIPGVEDEIDKAISNGTLVFNYTGHGGPSVLAHEKVITIPKIQGWNNFDKLPLFVTATCEFSRFDDKGHTSAGELTFLNPLGGAIALFTTTRIVYSSLNKSLNHSFYNFAFERDEQGEPYTLGQIMRHTKNGLSASVNKLNFTLLGDPAIRLIYPKSKIGTSKINDENVYITIDDAIVTAPIDSLKALSKIKVSGVVTNGVNESINDFNGEIFISVFDKQSQITTRGNGGASPYSFETFDKVIFRGSADVSNGEFDSEFVIPKDIRYNYDKGKVSYYAYSNNNKGEAFGAFSDVVIGGIDENAKNDEIGPNILLWLNNQSFKSGAKVGSRPVLLSEISDESGINTTGNGIGHDITCIIDEQSASPIILNDAFKSSMNDYTTGTIQYQLTDLEEGNHTLTLKAWDAYNNSSSSTINFTVTKEGNITTSNTSVYPNPVVQNQSSFVSFEHDEPNVRLDIQLLIFNMSGQLLSTTNTSVISLNNTIPPIEFMTETDNGTPLTPGTYIYKAVINSQTGRKGAVSGKILVTL